MVGLNHAAYIPSMDELLTRYNDPDTAQLPPSYRLATAQLQPDLKPANCLQRRSDDASDAGRQRRLKCVVGQKTKTPQKKFFTFAPTIVDAQAPTPQNIGGSSVGRRKDAL